MFYLLNCLLESVIHPTSPSLDSLSIFTNPHVVSVSSKQLCLKKKMFKKGVGTLKFGEKGGTAYKGGSHLKIPKKGGVAYGGGTWAHF